MPMMAVCCSFDRAMLAAQTDRSPARWTVATIPSATSAKASPASCADTVPDRMRDADQEQALLPEHAHPVEKLLVGIGVRERGVQPLRDFLAGRGIAPKKRGSTSAVHQPAAAVPACRRAAARRRRSRRSARQIRVLLQQREQASRRAAPPAGSCRTGPSAPSGFSARARLLEQLRQQCPAAPRAWPRVRSARYSPREPAPARAPTTSSRLLEAQRHQMLEQSAVVGVRGESRAAAPVAASLLVLEQRA